VWSPHDELCVTGTSADTRNGLEGRLVFVDSATFDIVYEVKYGDAVRFSKIKINNFSSVAHQTSLAQEDQPALRGNVRRTRHHLLRRAAKCAFAKFYRFSSIICFQTFAGMRGVMQCVHKAVKRSQKTEMVKEMCIIARELID